MSQTTKISKPSRTTPQVKAPDLGPGLSCAWDPVRHACSRAKERVLWTTEYQLSWQSWCTRIPWLRESCSWLCSLRQWGDGGAELLGQWTPPACSPPASAAKGSLVQEDAASSNRFRSSAAGASHPTGITTTPGPRAGRHPWRTSRQPAPNAILPRGRRCLHGGQPSAWKHVEGATSPLAPRSKPANDSPSASEAFAPLICACSEA